MPRYELTLDALDAFSDWDTWSAVRELIQNAVDAEIEHGATMQIEHVQRIRDGQPVDTLVISNFGATIPLEALLIGHTSKAGRNDLSGKWGEGLKGGILTLLRNGYTIKIRNGKESWNPTIERSEKFNATVPVFRVASNNKPEKRVQIEIIGLEKEFWDSVKSNFLFLVPATNMLKTSHGELILDQDKKGKIYNKGIYVRTEYSYQYGYNFLNASLDRDRKIVDDLSYLVARVMSEAAKFDVFKPELFRLLMEGGPETSGFRYMDIPSSVQEDLTERFLSRFGAHSLPVETTEQATKLAHFGKIGIQVPYQFKSILMDRLGTPISHLNNLKTSFKKIFDLKELSFEENARLQQATALLNKACSIVGIDSSILEKVSIVEFNDPELRGVYLDSERAIYLASSELTSFAKIMRTLIHEISHTCGDDGSKQHESKIGDLTEYVLNYLFELVN